MARSSDMYDFLKKPISFIVLLYIPGEHQEFYSPFSLANTQDHKPLFLTAIIANEVLYHSGIHLYFPVC